MICTKLLQTAMKGLSKSESVFEHAGRSQQAAVRGSDHSFFNRIADGHGSPVCGDCSRLVTVRRRKAISERNEKILVG